MKRIDLANPTPREVELRHSEFSYNLVEESYLPEADPLPESPLSVLLKSRRSRRTFKAISPEELNALLWHSARTIEVERSSTAFWQHRPTPSAGGRHPIDLLIFKEQDKSRSVYLYNALSHALGRLTASDSEDLDNFFSSVNDVVPLAQATIIWFAAQFERTLSRYENGESLVWRDAGALITTIALVAECLGLNSCAVGITGEPHISRMLNSREKVVGVGGVIVGQK
jgi:SagB-type dehydrogenase family enzyme